MVTSLPKAATASETPVHWGDGLWILHAYEQDVSLTRYFHSTLVDEAPVKTVLSLGRQ